MIRFFIGLMCVIAGASAIDMPAELAGVGDHTESWILFTILTAIGSVLMLLGVMAMDKRGY